MANKEQVTEKNKITFGLENVHYAVMTENSDGSISYGKPMPIKGAVELSLEPQGEEGKFKADNIDYFISESNEGYTGTLKVAILPDHFKQEILGEIIKNNIVIEVANNSQKSFALLFQFEGDKKGIRHVLYKCDAKRPKVASATKDGSNYNTDELSFTASARSIDKVVKIRTNESTDSSVYNAWFNAVPEVPSLS